MIKNLLDQREASFNEVTSQIKESYEETLVKALRFYLKADRDIRLKYVNYNPLNKNFVNILMSVSYSIGDTLELVSGKRIKVTESNIDDFDISDVSLVISIDTLESKSAQKTYSEILTHEDFIKSFGLDKFQICLKSGLNSFDDLINDPNYNEIIENLTNPFECALNELDEIQRIQYNLFSKQSYGIN